MEQANEGVLTQAGRAADTHRAGVWGPETGLEAFEPRVLMAAGDFLPRLAGDFAAGFGTATLFAGPIAGSGAAGFGSLNNNTFAGGSGSAGGRGLIRADAFHADPRFSTFTGRGFSSVILDTGADLDHPFFGPDANNDGVADRIVYQYDFGDNDADASDRHGHGSNVAGIVASGGTGHRGVAFEAGLIVLKVFSDSGAGSFGSIERALQWVTANVSRYNIASVNMSLGDGRNSATPQRLYGISDELATLAAQNVVVVAAAGNSYFDLGSVPGVSYPASDPSVLAVGAVYTGNVGGFGYGGGARANTTGADRLTPFSQRSNGTVWTLLAPGAPITSAGLNGGLVTMHGTSQAAPQVAGAAVLAQQLAVGTLGRRLSPAEFRSIVTTSGAHVFDGDDEDDNTRHTGQGFRRLDVLAMGEAILALRPAAAPPSTPAPTTPAQPPRPNRAPTMTSMGTLGLALAGRGLSISHATLLAAGNERDADGDALSFKVSTVLRGTLTKDGVPVAPGTVVRAGESLVYTAPAGSRGTLGAFTLVATDGRADSARPVTVKIKMGTARNATEVARRADVGEGPGAGAESVGTLTAPALAAQGVFAGMGPALAGKPNAPGALSAPAGTGLIFQAVGPVLRAA